MQQCNWPRFMIITVLLGFTLAWTTLAGAAELAGRPVYLEGQVAVRPARASQWQKARLNQDLACGERCAPAATPGRPSSAGTRARSSSTRTRCCP